MVFHSVSRPLLVRVVHWGKILGEREVTVRDMLVRQKQAFPLQPVQTSQPIRDVGDIVFYKADVYNTYCDVPTKQAQRVS
jgi:hypothetical protein